MDWDKLPESLKATPKLTALKLDFNFYSAGIDFTRQSLTSETSKVDPRTVTVTIFIMAVDP